MDEVYHLRLDGEDVSGAEVALLPGDPGRVEGIAGAVAERYGSGFERLASNREYRSFRTEVDGETVLVTSTGIGGPSASIALDELASLGVETFVRVGTTGSIRKEVDVGDVVVTSGSVRLDGASRHYAPIEYPAVAHHEVVSALAGAAEDVGAGYHVGVTASSATFYPGEEKEGYEGYVPRALRGATEEWRELNVLNYEMESSTVLTFAAARGLRAGCVTGVVNKRGGGGREEITEEALRRGEEGAIETAVEALGDLV